MKPGSVSVRRIRSYAGLLMCCLLVVWVERTEPAGPGYLVTRLAEIFVPDRAALREVCAQDAFSQAALERALGGRVSDGGLGRFTQELEALRDRLAARREFLLIGRLADSAELSSMAAIQVLVPRVENPNAYPSRERNTVVMTSGLLRSDVLTTLGSVLPLCAVWHPGVAPKSKTGFELTTSYFDDIVELVLGFQLMHEVAHIILGHDGKNQLCEEKDADRFAFEYLYAAGNRVLRSPKGYVPAEGIWPSGARQWFDIKTHPPRDEREESILRSRVFMQIKTGSWQQDKLSIPGAIVGTRIYDSDLYAANWGLEILLQGRGTRCRG